MTASRGGGVLLCADRRARYGGVTKTEQPPANPVRFNHIRGDGREDLVPCLEKAADNVRETALLNYVARPETPGEVGRGAT